jgi:hypothetical protein
VSLLDEQTRQPVWQETFSGVDVRQWLPGDRWMQFANWNAERGHYVLDNGPARYEIPAAVNQVTGRFQLPRDLRRGTYLLAVSILDPAGMSPSCRFAIENYFTGGRHPLGRIFVGKDVVKVELDRALFNDPATDTTIGYRVV